MLWGGGCEGVPYKKLLLWYWKVKRCGEQAWNPIIGLRQDQICDGEQSGNSEENGFGMKADGGGEEGGS